MTPDELRAAIEVGEQRGMEFKGPGRRDDKAFFAKVVRAILGMANKTDGGSVVVGVEDVGSGWVAKGLDQAELDSWNYDDVHATVSNYADPYVDFQVETISLEPQRLIAIVVRQFDEIPVICRGISLPHCGAARSTSDGEARTKRSKFRRTRRCAKSSSGALKALLDG